MLIAKEVSSDVISMWNFRNANFSYALSHAQHIAERFCSRALCFN